MNKITRRITGTLILISLFVISLCACVIIGTSAGLLLSGNKIPTNLDEFAYMLSLSDEDIVDEIEADLERTKELNRRHQMYELSYAYSKAGYIHKVECNDINDDPLYSFEKSCHQYCPELAPVSCNTDEITVIEPGVTDDQISEYRFYISLLPHKLTSAMVNDGYEIHLTNPESIQKDESTPEGFTREGYTDLENKQIYLNAANLKHCTIHEIGHVLAFDYGLNNIVKEKDPEIFNDIINNEIQNAYGHNCQGSLYIYLNADEAIAEFLYEYICYPMELKASAPVLYGCYEEALNNL